MGTPERSKADDPILSSHMAPLLLPGLQKVGAVRLKLNGFRLTENSVHVNLDLSKTCFVVSCSLYPV